MEYLNGMQVFRINKISLFFKYLTIIRLENTSVYVIFNIISYDNVSINLLLR